MSKKKDRSGTVYYHMHYYFDDQAFVDSLKKEHPIIYNAIIRDLKENGKPELCLECEAYYWDRKNGKPGCTLGGKITGIDISTSCPLDEQEKKENEKADST